MTAIRIPDLSARPFGLVVEHVFPVPASTLYEAWTGRVDSWFAAPGSVLMRAEVNAPFFFETEYRPEPKGEAERHPHYGRFLQLLADQLIQFTWVTGTGGTEGAETVITVELTVADGGTRLRLTHAGFATEAACDAHRKAWPMILDHLEKRLAAQQGA